MHQMKKRLMLLALLSVLLPACQKFLDKPDPTATKFDEFFNTEEDLRRVVYSTYLDVFTNKDDRRLLFYMEDSKSDNAYSRVEGDNHQRIANGSYDANTRAFEYYYTIHMKHIGRLNTYLKSINTPYVEDESIRTKYKGILEGLRVWHYFRIVSRWGNVPFYLEPVDISQVIQPAKSKEEILNTLFPMAEATANSLPDKEYNSDGYMFNKYSLKALIMRYALYNGRYDLAARLAKEIMDSGNYSLYPNYADLFSYKGDKINKEFIITMDMQSHGNSGTNSFEHLGPHFRTGKGQSYSVPLKSLVDAYWTLQGNKIDACPLHTKQEYELNPKLNRDPRYTASIMGQGDIFVNEPINIYDQNSPMFHEKERASRSGYWFRKFVDETDAFKGDGNMHFPILRYAEVLLTYAEAKIMTNNVDNLAKSCINQLRTRAGLDMKEADVTLPKYAAYTQQQWVELIRNERRTELAGEGVRYDDILRWKIGDQVMTKPAMGHTRLVNGNLVSLKIEDRSFQSRNYLWPFHSGSLKIEPGLTQNPGY